MSCGEELDICVLLIVADVVSQFSDGYLMGVQPMGFNELVDNL